MRVRQQLQGGFLCFRLSPGSSHGFTWFFCGPDVAALNVFGVDLFGKSFSHFRILNLYNLWTKRTSQMTLSPRVAFLVSSFPTHVAGDFDIYSPLPDPLRTHSAEDLLLPFLISPGRLSLALAYSTSLACTLASPLVVSAAGLGLISPLPLLPASILSSLGHPPPLHWFGPGHHRDHPLRFVFLSSPPLSQLDPDRLAHP